MIPQILVPSSSSSLVVSTEASERQWICINVRFMWAHLATRNLTSLEEVFLRCYHASIRFCGTAIDLRFYYWKCPGIIELSTKLRKKKNRDSFQCTESQF